MIRRGKDMKTKGLIVINDIPVICAECMACQTAASGKFLFCGVEKKMVYNAKPGWCPIMPLSKEVEMQLFKEGKC